MTLLILDMYQTRKQNWYFHTLIIRQWQKLTLVSWTCTEIATYHPRKPQETTLKLWNCRGAHSTFRPWEGHTQLFNFAGHHCRNQMPYMYTPQWWKHERDYNPETPCNFSHHSRVISTGWHAHLSYDWWRLPSGEAALALSCWQAPGNSSLDWTIVGVTLDPDSEVSVWVLDAQCWDSMRTRLVTSASAHGRVQGEGLHWGQQEAGAWA